MRQIRDILLKTSKNLDAFSHPRVSIAWQDTDLVYRRVHNQSVDAGDIIGKTIEQVVPDKKQAEALRAKKQQVLETGESLHRQDTVVLNGTAHTYDVTIEPTYNDKGSLNGLMTITVDITDLFEARKQLREANNRLTKLLGEALEVK